ncbi:sulfotransferase family 2 domain-containing protein [bacterium]|nr:sulfotransferase family 2 domain-containing protein [bacterium]
MLITEKFVFIHVPKTGGDFIRRVCIRRLPEDWLVKTNIAKHGEDTDIPEEYRHLPRFALVRNPWDWHVSWYHYLMGSGRPDHHRDRVREQNPWFVDLTDDFTLDFPATIRNLYQPDPDNPSSRRKLVRRADREGVDLLTLHFRRQLSESIADGSVTIGRFENLRHDFHDFLSNNDVPLTDRFRVELFERPPVNRSKRSRYQEYFDDDLAALLAGRASEIIDAWGYTFEDVGDEAHGADPRST